MARLSGLSSVVSAVSPATTTGSNAFLSDIHHGGDLPLGLWWLPHVAGVGVEPTYQAYETRENPLLDPAIVITS